MKKLLLIFLIIFSSQSFANSLVGKGVLCINQDAGNYTKESEDFYLSNVKHWGFIFYDQEYFNVLFYEMGRVVADEGTYFLTGTSTIEFSGSGYHVI